jgi:hypothetical protein
MPLQFTGHSASDLTRRYFQAMGTQGENVAVAVSREVIDDFGEDAAKLKASDKYDAAPTHRIDITSADF